MKRPSERMMIAFFQALFVFGHRPWKVADPRARDHMAWAHSIWFDARSMTRSVLSRPAHGSARRHETGQGDQERRLAQRNVFGEDLIPLLARELSHGQQSHQEFLCRALVPVAANRGYHRCLGS